MTELKEKHYKADYTKEPVSILLGGKACLIHPGGMGTGKQSRLTHGITWGSVTLAIAFRNKATRKLSNYSLTIPGEACEVYGFQVAREWAFQCLEELFGVITEEWIRRIDISCDLPGLDIQHEIITAFKEGRFITTTKNTSLHTEDRKDTGVVIGNRKRIRMIIYDKLKEHYSQSGEYRQALKQYRWQNQLPQAATRVEISIHRNWFSQFKDDKAELILKNPGVLLNKIFETDKKCFFRLTEEKPDREHNNQSRCPTLPLWKKIINSMIADSHDCILEFERLERGLITNSRAFAVVKGILCEVGAMMGVQVASLSDGMHILELLHRAESGKDYHWQECWEKKASKLGLIDALMQFP